MIHSICKWAAILVSAFALYIVGSTFFGMTAEYSGQPGGIPPFAILGWLIGNLITLIFWLVIAGPFALVAVLTRPSRRAEPPPERPTRQDPTL